MDQTKYYAANIAKYIADNYDGDTSSLKSMYQKCKFKKRITENLIACGKPEAVKFAVINGYCIVEKNYIETACGVSLEMLKTSVELYNINHIHQKFDFTNNTEDLANNAALSDLIDVIEYLREQGAQFNHGMVMNALRNDNLKLFKWLEINFPDKIYYLYKFRTPGMTYECFKYLYEKGHMPCYKDYSSAIESGDFEYSKWLKSIKCPGTFLVYDIPDDYVDKFNHNLNPGDIPWMLKLISNGKGFPDLDEIYWNPPLLNILEDIINYENISNDELNYFFEYIGKQGNILKYLDLYNIREYLEHFPYQRTIELIEKMKLNDYKIAELYNIYSNYDYDDQIIDGNVVNKIIEYLETKIHWGTLFLAELNDWIAREGSYQASEFTVIVEELWEKYEDKIPELVDPINKEKLNELINSDSLFLKSDMRDFLYELNFFKKIKIKYRL
jgi:hypothetical protein